MPQLNRKTEKKVKKMGVFTTNWYLYKSCLHPLSKESQTQNSETENYEPEERRGFNYNKEAENNKFEEILLEAIDEGLSLLGESPKQAVYFHLETAFNMKRHAIPHRIEEFTDAIEKLFGAGAKIIEIKIMKCLFKKVGYNFKHYPKQKSLTFKDYITAVKLEKDNYGNIEKQELNLNCKQNQKKAICIRTS